MRDFCSQNSNMNSIQFVELYNSIAPKAKHLHSYLKRGMLANTWFINKTIAESVSQLCKANS